MQPSVVSSQNDDERGGGARYPGDALPHDQRRARRPRTDRRLARSREDRVIGGVCGGIAEFIGSGSRGVRIVYALSVPVSVGTTAVGYLLLWLILPGAPRRA